MVLLDFSYKSKNIKPFNSYYENYRFGKTAFQCSLGFVIFSLFQFLYYRFNASL